MPGVARSPFARGASAGLLRALSDAEDALSRLDAATLAASDPVCEGFAARLAFREAAGWLARTRHWVYPLDPALRDLGLTDHYAAAALSRQNRRALPATLAETRAIPSPKDIAKVAGDRDVALALALARALCRLATTQTWRSLKDTEAAFAVLLVRLGGAVERSLLLPAWSEWKEASRAERDRLPPRLVAFPAAERWLALEVRLGRTGADAELRAGILAAAVIAQKRRTRAVRLPLWAGVLLRTGLRRRSHSCSVARRRAPWPSLACLPRWPGTARANWSACAVPTAGARPPSPAATGSRAYRRLWRGRCTPRR